MNKDQIIEAIEKIFLIVKNHKILKIIDKWRKL